MTGLYLNIIFGLVGTLGVFTSFFFYSSKKTKVEELEMKIERLERENLIQHDQILTLTSSLDNVAVDRLSQGTF